VSQVSRFFFGGRPVGVSINILTAHDAGSVLASFSSLRVA
jgi:hypothetical protein